MPIVRYWRWRIFSIASRAAACTSGSLSVVSFSNAGMAEQPSFPMSASIRATTSRTAASPSDKHSMRNGMSHGRHPENTAIDVRRSKRVGPIAHVGARKYCCTSSQGDGAGLPFRMARPHHGHVPATRPACVFSQKGNGCDMCSDDGFLTDIQFVSRFSILRNRCVWNFASDPIL